MANQNYAKGNSAFLQGKINWVTDNIKMAVLSPNYPGGSIAIANDQYFSSVMPYVLTGEHPIKTLTGRAVSVGANYGIAKADTVTFTTIAMGQIVGYYVIFKDPDANAIDGAPSDPSASPLIHLIDSDYGIGMGTNGGDIYVMFHANGIFRL